MEFQLNANANSADEINFELKSFSHFSSIANLSDAFEFHCTIYFLWVMLTICDLLLMILVEVSKDKNNNYFQVPRKL